METRTGRPRDPHVADVLERAVLRLVAAHGYDAVSVERIATVAGVGKPTIYRRWAGKSELFVDAVAHRLQATPDPVDTGTLRGDLIEMLRSYSAALSADGGLAIGVATTLPGHPELAAALRVHIGALNRRQADILLGRAVDRGELDTRPVDLQFVLDAAMDLFVGRAVMSGIDDGFVPRCVDEVLLPALFRTPPD